MKHLGTQKIETQRLILRQFTMKDAQAMYDNWASDPEVTRYLMWPAHGNVHVTEAVLRDWISHYEDDDFYQWAIVLKEQGTAPIGSISVVSHDDQVQKAHIGYCIGKDWWNRGIASEALQGVIDFLFREVGMLRIDSRHDVRNPYSGAVMKKCGMQYEGMLRQSDWNNQGFCDTCWYGILKEDWEKIRNRQIL